MHLSQRDKSLVKIAGRFVLGPSRSTGSTMRPYDCPLLAYCVEKLSFCRDRLRLIDLPVVFR